MISSNQLIEILPRKLFWTLVYKPINTDFGPLDLFQIYSYCDSLNSCLKSAEESRSVVYHYTSLVPSKRANSALLMCAYQVLCLNRSASQSWEPFASLSRFLPYRDSSNEQSKFELYILDCLNALEKAKNIEWFNIHTFDPEEYLKFSMNGGINWIVPEKILAFPNPIDNRGKIGLTPEEYAEKFESLKVKSIVRLNEITYDSIRFKKLGFRHHDLSFYNSHYPSQEVVRQFIEICRREKGIAVHCLNGLGKTPTLIGCYVINHFNFTGREYIAWARMCRPGSVQGQQQYFLCSYYEEIYQKINRVRPSSILIEPFKFEENGITRKGNFSAKSLSALGNCDLSPVGYKTKFNQLVKIDPLMIKLYGKNKIPNEDI